MSDGVRHGSDGWYAVCGRCSWIGNAFSDRRWADEQSAGHARLHDDSGGGESAWNSVKVSYAVSHLRAAATVLREQGLTQEADEAGHLADRIEIVQAARNDGGPDA